jgi:hypothetical protein
MLMDETSLIDEDDLPLEICGFEVNTAQDIYTLTKTPDGMLKLSLEAGGYVYRSNILLSDGRIVDGWVKI